MNRKFRYALVALTAAVVLLATAVFAWDRFLAPPSGPSAADLTGFTGFANSSAHVQASLVLTGQEGVITLHIGRGWHVNAHPASLDNLITTTALIEHGGARRPVQADYPAGQRSGITIDGTDILVYEDGIRIPVHQLALGAGDRLVVRIQACNDQGICLAPAAIPVVVNRA